METTDWERYGTGNYEKCADCMAHCGYEPTAVSDAVANPLKAISAMRGPRTDAPMAEEVSLAGQRPAEDVYDDVVAEAAEERSGKAARSAHESNAVA